MTPLWIICWRGGGVIKIPRFQRGTCYVEAGATCGDPRSTCAEPELHYKVRQPRYQQSRQPAKELQQPIHQSWGIPPVTDTLLSIAVDSKVSVSPRENIHDDMSSVIGITSVLSLAGGWLVWKPVWRPVVGKLTVYGHFQNQIWRPLPSSWSMYLCTVFIFYIKWTRAWYVL